MIADMQKQKIGAICKKICSILWYVAVVLLFVILVSVFASKISGKVPRMFGYSMVKIISGSMEDEIPTGTYVLLKKTDAEDVKKGDVICFYSSDPRIYGLPNTHRVAEDPVVTEGKITFITKGDANLKNDDYPAEGDRLVGKYVRPVKFVTGVARFAEGRGIYALVISVVFASFAMVIYSATSIGKRQSESPSAEQTEQNKKEKSE